MRIALDMKCGETLVLTVEPPAEAAEGVETFPELHVSVLPRPEGYIPPPNTPLRKERKHSKKARKPRSEDGSSSDEGMAI